MAVSLAQKFSLFLMAGGMVMLVVALAEPNWFSKESAGVLYHEGLWKFCVGNNNDQCESFSGSPDWITGPEALEGLSLSCAIAVLALSFRMLFHKTRLMFIMSAVLALLSGILGVAGAAVYRHKVDPSLDPAWCFFVNVVADSVMMLAGVVMGVHGFIGNHGAYHGI